MVRLTACRSTRGRDLDRRIPADIDNPQYSVAGANQLLEFAWRASIRLDLQSNFGGAGIVLPTQKYRVSTVCHDRIQNYRGVRQEGLHLSPHTFLIC